MKRFLAFLLTFSMLCSLSMLAGCAGRSDDENEMVTVYLPSTYTMYQEGTHGEVFSMEKQYVYDDTGRLIACSLTSTTTDYKQNTETEVENYTFTYDAQGNLASEMKHVETTSSDGTVTEETITYTYTYTYNTENLATHVVIAYKRDDGTGYDNKYVMEYDRKGNLVKVELQDGDPDYPQWWFFEYDKNNRMIKETKYIGYPYHNGLYEPVEQRHSYSQHQFTYDSRGNLTCISRGEVSGETYVGYDELDKLEIDVQVYAEYSFNEQGQLDSYEYDENGHLILEEQYEKVKIRGQWVERLAGRHSQDEHGNVIRFENWNSVYEVTYVELELSQKEAAAAKRQITGWYTQFKTGYFTVSHYFHLSPYTDSIQSSTPVGYLIENPPY